MKLFKLLIILLLLNSLTSCSKKDNFVNSYIGFDISYEVLDQYLKDQMKELNIPGMSIAIINDGKISYQNTFGYADVSKKEAITNQTIFEGASISKSVFAFFTMTFVEEGILDLDKPLFEYYPHPDIEDDQRYKKITARMVLSHRSGFPNWREDEDDKKLRTKFEPNTDYLYSGEGFQYLAMVLMHLKNTDHHGLESLFQERIAKPLGMEHTVFIQTPYTREHKAEPYDEEGNWIDWQNEYWYLKEDEKFYAPASIHSEPVDFSKWMIAVMNNELLSEASYSEMLKPHSKVPYDGLDVSYTLGYLTPHFPLTELYLHTGNNIGFTSWYTLDTGKDWGFVLFTNSEYGEQLGQNLFFYLITGPDVYKLYIILGILVVILSVVIYKIGKVTLVKFKRYVNLSTILNLKKK